MTQGTDPGPGSGSPSINNPLVTLYQYDLLNNLLRVDQKGTAPTDSTQWRTRTFTYNSLSQLLCAANPEVSSTSAPLVTCPTPDNGAYTAGTVRYAYDDDGNLITKTSPRPNQLNSSATVQTSYSYDLDNRLVQKTYNDGGATATAKYAYDGNTLSTGCPSDEPPGQTDSYPKGRRSAMCDGSGGTTWIHDKMGRITSERRSIAGVHGDYDTDQYNLDGSVSNVTIIGYGIAYTYNGAGRAITVKNFADPFTYVGSAHYASFGGLTSATVGPAPVTITDAFNKRLQPSLLSASTSAATIMSLSYDFGLGTNDNGNVHQITNNRDNNRTQNFVYDALNRIQQAYTAGPNWGEAFTIDAWGNLTNKSGISGKTYTETLNAAPATKQNQLNGYCHDAAGNLLLNSPCPSGPFTPAYTYDAENRLVWTAGYRYFYDGDGKRVEKCQAASPTTACATSGTTGTLYRTGPGADPLAETDLSGNVVEDYVFFNGRRIARRDASTKAVHLYFSDHLGTHSLVTDANGTMPPQSESDFYPYGGEIPITTGDSNKYKFTGKERDTESGLDNFGARYDASSLGRFMSIDPVVMHSQKMGDPQQFNLYSYVRNNPLKFVDPTGEIVNLYCLAEAQRKRMLDELENDTGLKLTYNAKTGDMDVVGDPSKASGGSATFRSDLLKAIDSKDVFKVVNDPEAGLGFYDSDTKTAHLNFAFFNKSRGITLGVDFYHELIGHGLYGYDDPGKHDYPTWNELIGHTAFGLERKVEEELGLPVRVSYGFDKRNDRYYIRVMEPESEVKKRGWFTWRHNWDIDVTDAGGWPK